MWKQSLYHANTSMVDTLFKKKKKVKLCTLLEMKGGIYHTNVEEKVIL